MIDYKTTNPGDELVIVGLGAPGFAGLGETVTVQTCDGAQKLIARNSSNKTAYFRDSCGAARLQHKVAMYSYFDILRGHFTTDGTKREFSRKSYPLFRFTSEGAGVVKYLCINNQTGVTSQHNFTAAEIFATDWVFV